jgi:methylmalonyl-CoA mutase N-terminal domain/subunit
VAGQRIPPSLEASAARRVRAFRRSRDQERARRALDALRESTARGENVMAAVVAALRARATLGEISELWRGIFGEHTPNRDY